VQFQNRVALIAGAAGGIGSAIARRLAGCGVRIAAVDLSEEGAARAAAAVREAGGEAVALAGDLSQAADGARVVEQAISAFGRLDIAVNCVGRTAAVPVTEITEDLWERVIDTDLKSCYNLFRPAVRHMGERGYGRILAISSRTAGGLAGQAAHAAAKAGVNGFVRALALEAGRLGVTVNAISPYYIDTPAFRELDPGAVERARKATAVRRMGTPEDVAAAAAFLVSDEAGFITGQILSVCGGSSIGLLQW